MALMVDCTCQRPGCGRVFQSKAYRLKTGRGKYCSRACHSSMIAQANHAKYSAIGPLNPNFKNWRSRDKRAYVDRFREKYPEKAMAHDCVEWAIRTGRLMRPTVCQRCGLRQARPLDSHHEDYSRPLVVEFLCRVCHQLADAARRLRLTGVAPLPSPSGPSGVAVVDTPPAALNAAAAPELSRS